MQNTDYRDQMQFKKVYWGNESAGEGHTEETD